MIPHNSCFKSHNLRFCGVDSNSLAQYGVQQTFTHGNLLLKAGKLDDNLR
jgi:hypothetical protein